MHQPGSLVLFRFDGGDILLHLCQFRHQRSDLWIGACGLLLGSTGLRQQSDLRFERRQVKFTVNRRVLVRANVTNRRVFCLHLNLLGNLRFQQVDLLLDASGSLNALCMIFAVVFNDRLAKHRRDRVQVEVEQIPVGFRPFGRLQ